MPARLVDICSACVPEPAVEAATPVVTALCHPDPRRLEMEAIPLGSEGQGPAAQLLGSTEATLEAGGVRIVRRGGGTLRLDGEALPGAPLVRPSDLSRGVVLEVGSEVALLLHLRRRPAFAVADLGMVGRSTALDQARCDLVAAAALEGPVLLLGESGTGKELAARALATRGPRAGGPFVAVNLAAIPSGLAASELFGHAAGAFTGAEQISQGLFARADGGTLFLDEVGAAPLDVQAMLLRVLESGEVRPLGSSHDRRVDVRVIAATDEDLAAAVRQGRFRAALYHRLAGLVVRMPPLRERREDLGRLLVHFLRRELRAARAEPLLQRWSEWFPSAAMGRLALHDWPGNVRELANVARRLAASACAGLPVDVDRLVGSRIASLLAPAPRPAAGPSARVAPSRIGEETLLAALRENRWRVGATARHLGISRNSLYGLMEASGRVRKAKEITPEELRTAHGECQGDLEAMAERLQASGRGIRLRLRDLGLV